MRVSIKGTNKEEYNKLTGAVSDSYDLPYKALEYLMDARVSCNVCLMISFSKNEDIDKAEKRLASIRPGLLRSLEKEHITLFPKVAMRLANEDLPPRTIRHRGKIITLDKETQNV